MEVPRHWRMKNQRYGLTGSVCPTCGKRSVSPRPICDECSDSGSSVYTFERRATRNTTPVYEPAQR